MKTFNIEKLIRKNVLQMKAYTAARDEFQKTAPEMIYLDANENPFDNGVNRYPDPQQQDLKKVIAAFRNVSAAAITLGNGSDELLDLIFRAFCTPDQDNIITLPPTYGMYEVLAGLNAVENRTVQLTPDFQLNIPEILNRVDPNTKLLFICSPNNPTGNTFPEKAITSLLEQFKGIIVLDEAYIDFSETGSWLQKIADYPNLIIIQTFSKAFGMAGIRLGAAYASEAITAILNKIKPPYNINTLTQEKALTLINDTKVKYKITLIKAEKENLIKVLLEVGFIKKIYPSAANFILVQVDDAEKRYRQLIDKGIVVRNRNNYPLCQNCLRITIGTKEENNQLLTALLEMNRS
ncbi:histidinol-phosphate transaminase [Flavobacterium sp. UBA4197]|uniref:histidinol-phosphate transaminase n=1 Tax=Flavobacterium sp. UBA4197 TaxID=1946546 RepID=UPI00257A14F9|nr:histidinol-phosphate transaminase [Flavobacterium sp. UBA4197]